MRSAPAVGFLVAVQSGSDRRWVVKTDREDIPLKGTRRMLNPVEALEYALRTGWTFLYRGGSQLYVTREVELLTLTFRKGETGWEAYPASLAKKEGMVFEPHATLEQITSFCVESYWYPTEDGSHTFQKLGLPFPHSDTVGA